MREQIKFIDMLSIICFCLTLETIDDTKLMEEHLRQQDKQIDLILEVLKNGNR